MEGEEFKAVDVFFFFFFWKNSAGKGSRDMRRERDR